MRVTAHQPEHMPWLGFFHKMAQADMYILLDAVQYRHRYFQNRNLIMGQAEPQWLNVPVRKEQNRYGPIASVRIHNDEDWRRAYWGSIEARYCKHPHFALYAPALQAIVGAPYELLIDFNMAIIGFFREALGIDTPIVRMSDLDAPGSKSELILQLCLATRASRYLSGPTGREYLDEAAFAAAGIGLDYHAFTHPEYPQRGHGAFIPCLSTLDLLMNCGPESRKWLLAAPADAVELAAS